MMCQTKIFMKDLYPMVSARDVTRSLQVAARVDMDEVPLGHAGNARNCESHG
jgi:hypothetical protein